MSDAVATCASCGAMIAPADAFCGFCGAGVGGEPSPPPSPAVNTATTNPIAATSAHLEHAGLSGFDAALGPEPTPRRPAGFWNRLAAWLVDFVLLFIASLPLAALGGDVVGSAALLAVTVSSIIYRPLMWRFRNGQTIGQQAMKIRTLKNDGTAIGIGRGIWRVLATWITGFIPIVGRLNVLSMLWNHERRCWFDRWSDTRVDGVDDPRTLGFLTRR